MDIARLYATFLAIAETGAISRAARRTDCSAAAASRQLEALEAHLGARLFDRTTRSVRLTAAGQRLLPHAQAVLQALEEAYGSVDLGRVQATVRVCAPLALGAEVVSTCLAELAAMHGGLRIELVLDNRSTDAFAEGVDVLVRSGLQRHDEPPDLVVRKLGAFGLGLYAAPELAAGVGARATPRTLAALPWVGHLGFADQAMLLRRGRHRETLRAQASLWGSDVLAVVSMAEQGAGCAVLPHWLARPRVVAGRLDVLLPTWQLPNAQVWLAWRNRGSNRQAVALVAQHLRSRLMTRLRGG